MSFNEKITGAYRLHDVLFLSATKQLYQHHWLYPNSVFVQSESPLLSVYA